MSVIGRRWIEQKGRAEKAEAERDTLREKLVRAERERDDWKAKALAANAEAFASRERRRFVKP